MDPPAGYAPEDQPHHVEMRLISIRDFLRFNVAGAFDFEASKSAITDIVTACDQAGVTEVLVDSRDASMIEVRLADVFSLVLHMISLGPDGGRRLAILNDPKDPIDRGKFFADIATARGRTVASFREFESAVRWLNDGQL